MTFEVEVGGRAFTVAVERTDRPGRFRVALDGVPRLVDVSRAGDFGLSLLDMGKAERGTVSRRGLSLPTCRSSPAPVRATFSSLSTDVPSL